MDQEKFLTVTPLGALHAVKESAYGNVTRTVLLNILKNDVSVESSEENLKDLTGISDLKVAKAIFYQLQVMHFVQGESEPVHMTNLHLEKDLPNILGLLSSTGKALLTDNHGLQLGNAGFPLESIEELAVASNRLSEAYRSNDAILSKYIGNQHNCVGIMNNQGLNQLGVFSLNIGQVIFTLTVGGIPFLNQRAFRDLIWVLVYRYGITA